MAVKSFIVQAPAGLCVLFRKVSLEQMSSRLNVVAPSLTDQETDPVQGHLAACAENERQSSNFKFLRLK